MDDGNTEDRSGALETHSQAETTELSPVVVRKAVAPRGDYQQYRDDLREDFLFSCAYCSITETEAQALGFNIDHYLPREHYPALVVDYANLMWSCQHCNSNKSDFPKPGQQVEDRRIIKVDTENPRLHLALDGDSDLLMHRTPTGKFNIDYLRLNRQTLQRLRQIRRRLAANAQYIAYGIGELLNVRLDSVSPAHRRFLFELQARVARSSERAMAPMRELIEATARSPFLDADPERSKQLAVRRQYLDSEKAIGPHLVFPGDAEQRRRPPRKRR